MAAARYARVDRQAHLGGSSSSSRTRSFVLLLLLIGLVGYPTSAEAEDSDDEGLEYDELLIWLCAACWTLMGLWILCCSSSPANSTGEQGRTVELRVAPVASGSSSGRIVYLDNLKTMLTVQVMVHHTLGCFSDQGGFVNVGCKFTLFNIIAALIMAADDAFFMSLFFFIAGYFTPSSYRRKGARNFLLDRLARLGVPFAVYALLLGPRMESLKSAIETALENEPPIDEPWDEARAPLWSPHITIAWFPNWLLVLSVAYVVLQHAPHGHSSANAGCIPVRLPTVQLMLAVGGTMGVAWGLLRYRTSFVPGSFIGMLTGPLSLPFYILFFFGGCAAGSNGWLEEDLPKLTRGQCCAAYLYSLAFVMGLLLFLVYEYAHNGGVFLSERGRPKHTLAHLDFDHTSYSVALYHLFAGAFSFTMSLTCVHFCSVHLAFSNRVTRWLAANSYAAYLMQEPAIIVAVYSYRDILGMLRGPFFEHCTSSSELPDAHMWHRFSHLAGGFMYTAVFSVVFTWLLAAALRAIPGVRKVL